MEGRISSSGNSVNIECSGIALVATEDQALTILAQIDQLIRIAQVGYADASSQFGQRSGHGILVLHWYEGNGDADHASNAWRPDACSHNDDLSADTTLRCVYCLHISVVDLDTRNASVWIEGYASRLLGRVCQRLGQDRSPCGAIGWQV